MLIRRSDPVPIRSSEITPEDVYLNRRSFMRRTAGTLAVGAVASALPASLLACDRSGGEETRGTGGDVAPQGKEELTAWEDFTGYNNYYEFGTDKDDPAKNARNLRTKPWTVKVDGLVAKPADYALEDFLKPHRLQERVYRHRCVEAWSMVVPWLGFPIADLVRRVQPTSGAKYVQFQTLADPRQMPGLRPGVLDWPYTEGLRMDEAMHPLALFVVGAYGKMLLPQNGAPLRHVVPWKYGFKGAKSIVRVTFTDRQPRTAWNASQPSEYGFYANVNPEVDHPRWSQGKERRIGEFRRRETLMFNGYPQVASLYAGMDLRKNY